MSRSFKKAPVYKDGSNHSKKRKYWKRQGNKKVRKLKLQTALRKSNKYRKIGESWDICDYRFYITKPDNAASEDLEHWKKYCECFCISGSAAGVLGYRKPTILIGNAICQG